MMAAFLNVNIYVITFFIDIFVVFVCIHRYVKLNSGKVVNLDYVCVCVCVCLCIC